MLNPSEELLGRMAVRNRLISEEQLKHCLVVQEQRVAEGLRMSLGVILIEQGLLDQHQLEELIRHQAYFDARKDDTLFAKIAVSNNFITQAVADAALADQESTFNAGQELVRIKDALVQAGQITIKQAQAVQKGLSTVHTMRRTRTITGRGDGGDGEDSAGPAEAAAPARTAAAVSPGGYKPEVFAEDMNRLVKQAEKTIGPGTRPAARPATPVPAGNPATSSGIRKVVRKPPAQAAAAAPAPAEAEGEEEGDSMTLELPNCRISTEPYFLGEGFDKMEFRIITVVGSLDAATFPEFDRVIADIVAKGVHRLVVDLKDLEYISSAGLGVLIDKTKQCRENKGDLRLANVPAKIKHVLDILGYTSMIRQYNAVKGAVLSFQYL